tara:strand:- start:1071 stop:1232 length:162 start_codon:yes stop_codon:yes gene_type:complete
MNRKAKEYYLIALIDIQNGNPKQRMLEVLQYYSDLEEYEACQGIKKAIDETWN